MTENEIFKLTNLAKRKAFLDTWERWPVLASVPELKLVARQVLLPNGKRIVSLKYASSLEWLHACYFQVLNQDEGIKPFNDTGMDSTINTLKDLRVNLIARRKKKSAPGRQSKERKEQK